MKKIIIGLVIAACIQFLLPLFLVIVLPILVVTTLADTEKETNPGSGFVVCNETQSINMSMWNKAFAKANALANSGDTFIRYSEEYNLDPVLFSAVAMHETGWGTSNAVKNYNNPGGLMNPATNWSTLIRYSTLDEGIHAMAKTLNKLINERGLVTINDLGSAYAPLDAANDPNGLNAHWVPTVTKFANEFGGLTMNC
ncbi:TrsG protein, partial [Butyricicoccus sp. 1XD8-22]